VKREIILAERDLGNKVKTLRQLKKMPIFKIKSLKGIVILVLLTPTVLIIFDRTGGGISVNGLPYMPYIGLSSQSLLSKIKNTKRNETI
jgi:hypothetical protein